MTTTPRLLVVGATSAIAHEVARRYAARNARLFLAGRDAAGIAANAADLTARGAESVVTAAFDALDTASHEAMLDKAFVAFDGFDAVQTIIVHDDDGWRWSIPGLSRACHD